MMATENILWLLVVAGGPFLLAILFGFALLRKRRLSRSERSARDRGTRDVFDERS
ncbi:hypothetical protein [Aquibium sp. ELW1220]|uniref:hypothetical protein n=1 Tax=Aquibium sp. ELW1220 TaxID=2976766 RepID=UPI0025B113E3|nr:hypothetical protein [Aquibium sp. ELW1220]MDN2578480.1 hypothetical protein [Aquibium sp. ELW1220]